MAETIQKMKTRKLHGNRKSSPSRKRKSRAVGTAAKKGGTKAEPESVVAAAGVEEECEDGAALLQSAANHAAAEKSAEIATHLAARAARGDAASTKMLVELMVGKNLPAKKKKRIGLTSAQRLALAPPWVEPPGWRDGEEGKGRD